MGAGTQVERRVDDVAEHRAGGRRAAGASAVEHERVDEVALDEHRVEAVADGGERVVARHHRRVDADADLVAVGGPLDDPEQLHDVAEAVGDGDLRRR